MRSSSKSVLPTARLSERRYKLGVPRGGNPEDFADPDVRLKRMEEQCNARLAEQQQRHLTEREEAFLQGRREGIREAERSAQVRIQQEQGRWLELCQQLLAAREEVVRVSERQLVELTLAAVEAVAMERPGGSETIAATLREAFQLLRANDRITIVCSPDDFLAIQHVLKEDADTLGELTAVRVREDSAIRPGGCLVETEWGSIDARIEKRLSVLKQLLRAEMPTDESTPHAEGR